MFLKKVMLLLLIVIMLAAVTACGGATPAPPAEQPAEEPAEPAEEPPAAAEPEEITLTFWTFVDAHADYYQEQVKTFNAENPNVNITLEATSIPYQEMHDKLLIALQSGTGAPDIVDIEIAKFGTFMRGDIQLHDLTPVADRHREDLVVERLAPYQFQGKQYGLPTHLGAFVMYYNTELMEQAGVDIDSIETWDDYIEAGKKVKEETEAWMGTVESTGRFSILGAMLTNGGGTYDKDGNFILDSPENAEALQLVSDLYHEHEIVTIAPGGQHHDPSYYEFMNAGKSASIWMPQWYAIRFTEFMPDLEGKIAIRPLPAFEEGGLVSTMGGGTGTAITKQIDSGKVDVAMDFLEHAKLTYDAGIQTWTVFGFDPFRLDVYDDPQLQEPDPYFSNESVLQNIQIMLDRMAPEYTGPRYAETMNLLNEKVAFGVIEEGLPPEEVLQSAAEEIEALQ